MRPSAQPLAWYLGIAVVVPLLRGASFGIHLATTLGVACAFFVVFLLWPRR